MDILLLDSAARFRMHVGDMPGAAPLVVSCAVELNRLIACEHVIGQNFGNIGQILLCSVDPLVAQLHSLTGNEDLAQKGFERIVCRHATVYLGDLFHPACAHLALPRANVHQPHLSSNVDDAVARHRS
jgi:hypothetical protein